MKCPNCGTENDENAKFCQVCGWALGPAYDQIIIQPPTASKSILKWILVLIVVLILVGAGVGAIYTQAWSKIKVLVTHSDYSRIGVGIYIDGVLKASVGVDPGTSIVGVWSVVAGTHTVQVDAGHWHVDPGYWYTITHWLSPDETVWVPATYTYIAADGFADITYAYGVGPLYTKNVYITLS